LIEKTVTKRRTDRAWFSPLVRHPARKRGGSILTTSEPARYCFLAMEHDQAYEQIWSNMMWEINLLESR